MHAHTNNTTVSMLISNGRMYQSTQCLTQWSTIQQHVVRQHSARVRPVGRRNQHKGASILCHVAECNETQLCQVANAKNNVDVNAMWLWHGFCMPQHVAECHTAWKFKQQSVGIINGLSYWYLPSTVMRHNFWCGMWCLRVSHLEYTWQKIHFLCGRD